MSRIPQGIALGILRHQWHKFSVLEGFGGEKEASMSSMVRPLYSFKISFSVAPCAKRLRMKSTVKRVPCMTGLPTIFRCFQSVGFSLLRGYPMTTTIHFSGLNTEPASLIHLASDFHSGLPFWLCPQTSLLTCWLNFS